MGPAFVISLGANAVSPGHLHDARCLHATGRREPNPIGFESLRADVADGRGNADLGRRRGPVLVSNPAPDSKRRIHCGLDRNRAWAGEDQRRRSNVAAPSHPGRPPHGASVHRRARRMGSRFSRSERGANRVFPGSGSWDSTLQGPCAAHAGRWLDLANRPRHPDSISRRARASAHHFFSAPRMAGEAGPLNSTERSRPSASRAPPVAGSPSTTHPAREPSKSARRAMVE